MVKALHAAGLEVILDVVYNHTAEGNHLGPMLSFKGIDNARVLPARSRTTARYYMDYTGTGNSLNMRHPHVLQLVMDSLRYWVHGDARRRLPLRPGVDAGARAATTSIGCRRSSTSSTRIRCSAGVKLIAEPWDVGEGGYQVGNFPVLLVRVERQVPRHACATTGAATDADARRVRLPPHRQLRSVSGRRRASRTRASTSSPRTTASRCATSSPTTRSTTRRTARTTATARATTDRGTAAPRGRPTIRAINALRARQQRNFLATLLLSQGVPMLLGGDEIGRTQQGNNNAYCQDNEISWFDWEHADSELLEFTRGLIAAAPASTRCSAAARWFQGRPMRGIERQRHRLVHARRRARCRTRTGATGFAKSLGVFLNGDALARDRRARRARCATTASCCCSTRITSRCRSRCRRRRSATAGASSSTRNTELGERDAEVAAGEPLDVASRAMVVLSRPTPHRRS